MIPPRSQVFARTSVILLRVSDKSKSLTFTPFTLGPTSLLSSGYWNRHDLWRDVVYLMLKVEMEIRRPNMCQDHARNSHPLLSRLLPSTEVVMPLTRMECKRSQPRINQEGWTVDLGALRLRNHTGAGHALSFKITLTTESSLVL